jgi:hypothetical protein
MEKLSMFEQENGFQSFSTRLLLLLGRIFPGLGKRAAKPAFHAENGNPTIIDESLEHGRPSQ